MKRPSKEVSLSTLIISSLVFYSPIVVHGQSIVAMVGVGEVPLGLTYDSGKGEVFVASNNGTISVISDATNNVVANINLGTRALPHNLAYDPAKGEVFVTTQYGGEEKVYIISDTTNTLVAKVPWPSTSVADVVYDSGNGEIYVANPGWSVQSKPGGPVIVQSNASIFVVSDATNTIVANISLGSVPANLIFNSSRSDRLLPIDMVYDSGKGEIFVTDSVYNYTSGVEVASIVSVISDITNTVVATVNIGGGTHPEGLAYDSARGEVFVANSNGTNVSVISDATNTLMASVRVEAEPTGHEAGTRLLGITYDPSKGEVFVANNGDYLPNTVSVISDATNTVVATVDVGYGPAGVVYDSGKGEVFVANSGDNTVSVISDATTVPEFPSPYALPAVFVAAIGASIGIYALIRRHGVLGPR
jgi:YVTN family beta-propeller protein